MSEQKTTGPNVWGVLGCGVIGDRRSAQLPANVRIGACYDVHRESSTRLAAKHAGARVAESLPELLSTPSLQAVIIAAINSELAPLAQAALDRGLHILVEKPAARSIDELKTLKNPHGAVIKIGFNHRFHPAFARLKQELAKHPDDPILNIRAQYGNGSRVGFENEWRAQVETGGGGELLDQGVHVLDLASELLPDLRVMAGYTKTHYWKMPVDDNAWGILNSPKTGATFSFHVSSSEWKNEFRFEVYTRRHKYQWLGLGRSYGAERLLIHAMNPEMGPPDSSEISFPPEDHSWLDENSNFLSAIEKKAPVDGGYDAACRSLSLVKAIYESSKSLQETSQHPHWWNEAEIPKR